jgi:hypothetical protein
LPPGVQGHWAARGCDDLYTDVVGTCFLLGLDPLRDEALVTRSDESVDKTVREERPRSEAVFGLSLSDAYGGVNLDNDVDE